MVCGRDIFYNNATPLVRWKNAHHLQVSPEAVMPSLRSIERWLLKNNDVPNNAEVKKPEVAGFVVAYSRDNRMGGVMIYAPSHGSAQPEELNHLQLLL